MLMVVPATADAAKFGQRTLRPGMSGPDVKTLQKFLTMAGYRSRVDGTYGRGTYNRVRTFEYQEQLSVDGIVAPKDARKIYRAAHNGPSGGVSFQSAPSPDQELPPVPGNMAKLMPDGTAAAPKNAPAAVKRVIAAGNKIAFKPYIYGGGHNATFQDSGYDCSGSVSYALHGGNLIKSPIPSGSFASYGPRPGQVDLDLLQRRARLHDGCRPALRHQRRTPGRLALAQGHATCVWLPSRSPVRPLALISACALGAAALGCGGGKLGGDRSSNGACDGRTGDAKVICNWTETLRGGDPEGAARYFSIPAVVQNGTPPLRLATREAIVVFNRTLPCGARLTGTRRQGRYTVATFRLVKRPGAACDGIGGKASTAFLIRGNLIRAWLRVPAGAALPTAPSQTV